MWRTAMLALALLLSGVSVPACGDDPECAVENPITGQCMIWVRVGSSTGGGAGDSGHDVSGGEPRTCFFQDREIPCQTALGYWSSYAASWCRRLPTQPGFDDPAWNGRTDGAIYACTRPGLDAIPDTGQVAYRWLPSPPEAPDPEDLARRLLAGIDFEAPEMGMFPRGDSVRHMGFVGWNMWLWSAPSSRLQWGPVTESMSEGGVSVSLTATVASVVWDMGNGESVTCGRGVP